jgi:hypothetical protein
MRSCTYCLARAVEADDNDRKLVLPIGRRIGISTAKKGVSMFQTWSGIHGGPSGDGTSLRVQDDNGKK